MVIPHGPYHLPRIVRRHCHGEHVRVGFVEDELLAEVTSTVDALERSVEFRASDGTGMVGRVYHFGWVSIRFARVLDAI